MSKNTNEFDFPAWMAKRDVDKLLRPFPECVKSAAESLSFGQGRLRSRVYSALFSLCLCDRRGIPKEFQTEFDELCKEIRRRVELADHLELWHVDLGKLRHLIRRCNFNTAERMARKIIEWDRALGGKCD
jgi:hypothetical protein